MSFLALPWLNGCLDNRGGGLTIWEMEIPDGKGRLGWFDAMRGLAIILVVLGHILNTSFLNTSLDLRGDHDSILLLVICMFYMPLFFLISGFFAYRVCERWTAALVGDIMKRKVQAQIICTLIFFALLLFCRDGLVTCQHAMLYYGSVLEWLSRGFFCGYWFTIVLFQMFVVFLVLSLASKLFRSELVLVIGLILTIAGLRVLRLEHLDDSMLWGVLCTKNFCHYFQFFALGIFCRKYRELFETVLSKNWFKAGITICAIVCLVLYFQDGLKDLYKPLYDFIHHFGASYSLLFVVVSFFFWKREFFEKQNATSSVLRYIGRRTLDIYMIHYFFIPDLSVLSEWLAPNSMFIFQLAIGLVVSALIVAVCLLLSEILRSSDFLSAWLFGVKIKRRE